MRSTILAFLVALIGLPANSETSPALLYFDHEDKMVAAQDVSWQEIMALGQLRGMSDSQINDKIKPIGRETFESQDARAWLSKRVGELNEIGVGEAVAQATFVFAYSMFIPEYDFANETYTFCRPSAIRIPSQATWGYAHDDGVPTVTLEGSIRIPSDGLVSREGFGCGLSRPTGDLRSVSEDEIPVVDFISPRSQYGISAYGAVDIHLKEDLQIKLNAQTARLLNDRFKQSDHVQLIYFCKMAFDAGSNSFSCQPNKVIIGYAEKDGDLLRASKSGGQWIWSLGSSISD